MALPARLGRQGVGPPCGDNLPRPRGGIDAMAGDFRDLAMPHVEALPVWTDRQQGRPAWHGHLCRAGEATGLAIDREHRDLVVVL